MKKKILILLTMALSMLTLEIVAGFNFSQPVLKKAYERVNFNIEEKVKGLVLDGNSRKVIEEKKKMLGDILIAIDNAHGANNKAELKKQVQLFRKSYKDTIIFIQSIQSNAPMPIIQKDVPSSIIKTDITYYSDSFEGKKTANGNIFSQENFSAAACSIAFNTLIQVEQANNKSVIVKVNDRPNCSKYPNLTDLTKTSFSLISKISTGKIKGNINILGTVSSNYTKKYVPVDVFKTLGIQLNENIPNTYLKNETLHISGMELKGSEYTVLYLKSPSGKDITLGMKKGANGNFSYSYPLEEYGTYQIVLSSGLGFKTSIFLDIIVLEDSVFSKKNLLSPIEIPQQIKNINVTRVELPDFTSLYLFPGNKEDFNTLTIKGTKETFTFRGFGDIAIRGDALRSIDVNKPIFVEIVSQKSSTPFSHDTYTKPTVVFSKSMTLVAGYKEEKNENITVGVENTNLVIRGIVANNKKVKSDIILTLPNGDVFKDIFDKSSIDSDGYMKRGKVFEKVIPLTYTGIYMVEINYDNGFAAYNGPIVFGAILAAYPSDTDSVDKVIGNNDGSIVTLESLQFVNAIRAKSGKSALSISDTLNNLATIKANDMANHNNLSHTDSRGEKINGTAKRSNIKIAGGIGENIAGGNLSFRILLIGLANSGGHRANMLDDWKKMGIGYVVKDGQVYYVQVFGE